MSVCVCMLVHGSAGYTDAARAAIGSVLALTGFDVFIGHGGDPSGLPQSPRVILHDLGDRLAGAQRPYRFLLKFEALAACIAVTRPDIVVMMDADAVLARPLTRGRLERALDGADLAMVEQTTVTGSTMARPDFLAHYAAHALPVITPGHPVPDIDTFRYYNSGVVIGRADALRRLSDWARRHVREAAGTHEIGGHMVADQDYFQVWANSLHPGSCRELPWTWNHCEWWDQGFPRPGLLFAHFSNFCDGPTPDTIRRMRRLRRPDRVVVNTLAGMLVDRQGMS